MNSYLQGAAALVSLSAVLGIPTALSRPNHRSVQRLCQELGVRSAMSLPGPWLQRFADAPWPAAAAGEPDHGACNVIFGEDGDGSAFFAGDFNSADPQCRGSMLSVVAARLHSSLPGHAHLNDSVTMAQLFGADRAWQMRVRGDCVYLWIDASKTHRSPLLSCAEKLRLVQALQHLSCADLAAAQRECKAVLRNRSLSAWRRLFGGRASRS